jgi:hypothetical protein
MNIKHEAILSRFPEYRERLEQRIETDEDFKWLCSDYEQCMDMLKSLTNEPEHTKLAEYLEIKIELEQEVLKYLFE